MKKLTDKTKYSYNDDGDLVIYLKHKITNKWCPVFECHPSCLSIIKQNKSIIHPDVVLISIYKE